MHVKMLISEELGYKQVERFSFSISHLNRKFDICPIKAGINDIIHFTYYAFDAGTLAVTH